MKYLFSSSLVIATAVGLAAGAVASALTTLWLVPKVTPQSAPLAPRTVQVRTGTVSPETLANTVAPAVFLLVPKTAPKALGPGMVFSPESAVGHAVALTADGWIAFDAALPAGGLIAVSGDGRSAPLRAVVADAATGIAFAKLELNDLPSLPFPGNSGVRSGDALYLVTGRGAAAVASVSNARAAVLAKPEDAVVSSESLNRRIAFFPALGKAGRGVPAFDAGGALSGIVVGERGDRAVPIEFIRPILNELFKTQTVHRPYLGAQGLDVSGLLQTDSAAPRRGIALVDLPGRPAVAARSPAAAAGLRARDLVLDVDGAALSSNQTLAEALIDYDPGDAIKFTVRRGDETLALTVTLGDTSVLR